ncbi:MAG: hypothetical protein U0L45_08745 [Alistipes sp.]|nr:hypothetical protein [Alistipes sp.]
MNKTLIIKESRPTIIRDMRSVSDIVDSAVSNIIEGNIDPMQAYAELTTFERAIAKIKDNPQVRDICLRELGKYGKQGATIGELVFTEAEAGVKYDYSGCGCTEYAELIAQRAEIDAHIKEWEKVLKSMPATGLADPNTGEMLYPPAKSSKTIIKATTKR